MNVYELKTRCESVKVNANHLVALKHNPSSRSV